METKQPLTVQWQKIIRNLLAILNLDTDLLTLLNNFFKSQSSKSPKLMHNLGLLKRPVDVNMTSYLLKSIDVILHIAGIIGVIVLYQCYTSSIVVVLKIVTAVRAMLAKILKLWGKTRKMFLKIHSSDCLFFLWNRALQENCGKIQIVIKGLWSKDKVLQAD